MKKTTIDPAKYKKLLKLAKGGGSKEMIGTVLGSLDPAVTEAYLAHLKANDPGAAPGWHVEEDDDLDDFGLDEEEAAPEPPKKQRGNQNLRAAVENLQKSAAEQIQDVDLVTEELIPPPPAAPVIPEKFHLRTGDGETVDLECFSKHPRHGYYLRIPVPSDMREVTIKGHTFTVDYLAVQRDPDGITRVDGVNHSNKKISAVIEFDL